MNPTFTRDDQAELVVASIHAMATGTRADFDALFHPEVINREAVAEPPATRAPGPEAMWATAQWLRAAYSDLAFTVNDVVVEGDLVVTHGTMSGRHTGDFVVWTPEGTVERAFAPTGRSFEVNHAHFCRVRDGLVAEHWAVRDDNAQALQLGWIPPSPWFLLRCALATARHRRAAATT